jgi:hypothetical protein
MQITKLRPTRLQVTLSPFELAALIAAGRWVVEGAEGEMPDDAIMHLKQVLDAYDKASREAEQVVRSE